MSHNFHSYWWLQATKTGPCSSQPLRLRCCWQRSKRWRTTRRRWPRHSKGTQENALQTCFSTRPCCSIIIVYFAKKNGELQLLWLPPLHLRTCVFLLILFGYASWTHKKALHLIVDCNLPIISRVHVHIYICNIYISCCQSMFEVFERPLVVLKITQITQIICKWFSTARLDCWRIYWKGPFSGFCFGFVLFQCFNPNSCCPESQCPSENRRFFCWSNH